MRSLCRHLLAISLVLSLLPGCALLQKFQHKRRAAGQEGAKAMQLVGTIVLVSEEGGYVLIDSGSLPSPVMGTAAESRAADSSKADLRITEIRKRPFVIADIVSGNPRKGDQVFQ